MILRQARLQDAEAIKALANDIIENTQVTFTTKTRTLAEVEAEIRDKGKRFLVAEVDGILAGYASYGAFRSGPGYAHTAEHTIHLAPTSRGKGIGRALWEQLEQVARDDGIHVLVAGISGANPGAIGFHTAMGFSKAGQMPQVGRKFGEWLDLVLMQKILR